MMTMALLSLFVTFAQERQALMFPHRLRNDSEVQLYTRQQVCEYTKKNAPQKKAALVVVKTHYCDDSSQVCLKTAAFLADPNNTFVHENFEVFDSRFEMRGQPLQLSAEREVRQEWQKDDSNPEYYVLDVATCEIIFRDYAMHWYEQGVFATIETSKGTELNMKANLEGVRKMLLSSERVRALLGPAYANADKATRARELAKVNRNQGGRTLNQVHDELDAHDRNLGLR